MSVNTPYMNSADNPYNTVKPSFLTSTWRLIKSLVPFFGLYNILSSKKNEELSTTMTGLFKNTKINVYVMDVTGISHAGINAFTIPGAPVVARPLNLGIVSILDSLFLGLFSSIAAFLEIINRQNEGTNYSDKITIDDKGIIDSEIPECTIYITSKTLEVLTLDEIKGLFMHEVGHSTIPKETLFTMMLNNIFKRFSNFSSLVFVLIPIIILNMLGINFEFLLGFGKDVPEEERKRVAGKIKDNIERNSFLRIVCLMFTATFLIYMIFMWRLRKIEYNADSFAVKCGYGDNFKSALLKIQDYTQRESLSEKNNIVEKFVGLISKLTYPIILLLQKLRLINYFTIDKRVEDAEALQKQLKNTVS